MTDPTRRLRADAKALKKAFQAGDPAARARAAAVLGPKPHLNHADALHVIAIEQGAESWPKLRFAREAAAMDRDARAEALKRALYFGQHWRAERLLTEDPDLPSHNLGLQIATYDRAAVARALRADPEAATRPVAGPRMPLLHLAFSHHIHAAPECREDMLAIAQMLVDHGADVNAGIPHQPDSAHPLPPLYGAIGHARNLVLGAWLLEHGANPDDDESLYHATEIGSADGVRLLLAHGAKTRGTNALARALDFDHAEMVGLLLAAGAATDEPPVQHPSGETIQIVPALHQAARRGCSAPVIDLLLRHGADPARIWQGMTPYATARVFGNDAAAGALAAAGHETALSPNEALLASCARGRMPTERLDPSALSEEQRRLLVRLAGLPGRLAQIEALCLAGLSPDETEEMGLPPLHIAGWEGVADHLRFFLSFRPDLHYRNRFGGDALDTVVHGSEFSPERASRDHIACAQALLEAGSPLYPDFISGCGNEAMTAFLEEWGDAHPESMAQQPYADGPSGTT